MNTLLGLALGAIAAMGGAFIGGFCTAAANEAPTSGKWAALWSAIEYAFRSALALPLLFAAFAVFSHPFDQGFATGLVLAGSFMSGPAAYHPWMEHNRARKRVLRRLRP